MKIVSWNCFRGECYARAADLDDLKADLIILQECSEPAGLPLRPAVWFGTNPKHCLAVVGREGLTLEALPQSRELDHSVFPLRVGGDYSFNVLAIWAMPDPTYVEAVLRGLDVYGPLLEQAPTIVVGDFNSHSHFNRPGRPTHEDLVRRLMDDFDLVSAYHEAPNRSDVAEDPTHFWRWKPESGFHIDYCFVPRAWSDALTHAYVVDEPAGSRRSDHRPLVVEFDPMLLRRILADPPGRSLSV